MSRGASDEPVYRFLLLPSFSHPISVRVTIHADGTGTVVSQIGGGAGGYAPKQPISDITKQLTSAETDRLREVIKQQHFWSLSTEPPPDSELGCDGTEWIFEGSDGGHYHVAERWEGAELTELGRFFLDDLAGMKDEAKNASATVSPHVK